MKNISKTIAVVAVLALANTAMAFDPFAYAGVTSFSGSSSSSSSASSSSSTAYNGGNTVVISNTDVNQNSNVNGDNNVVEQNATATTETTIEGTWGNWGSWGTCTYGTQTRTRACTGGGTCAGASTDTRSCDIPETTYDNCSVNGTFVAHGDSRTFYSTTSVDYDQSCGLYDQTRTCNDGNMSGSSSYRYASCNVGDPEPVDGGWSAWTISNYGTWGSCVNGSKSKTVRFSRTCSNPYPAHGGADCVGSSTKTEVKTASCEIASALEIETKNPVEFDVNSARLKGRVLSDDASLVWFALSRIDSNPSCSNTAQRVGYENGKSEGLYFYANVNNLRENTRYYYKACGTNSNGSVVSGEVVNFKTEIRNVTIPAEVATNAPTNIRATYATLNGHVTINGTVNPKVYFVFGTSSSRMNTKTTDLAVSGDTYFQAIQGLIPNTKYYYQAVVKDKNGVVDRGIIRSFITGSEEVTVNTSATTLYASPSYTVATLHGRVNGGDGVVKCYFEYGPTSSLGLRSTSYFINSNTTKSCSRVIRGLNPGSRYYYRAVIEDNGVKYNGEIKSFVQKSRGYVPPARPVTPVSITPVENVTVTLIGEENADLQINKFVSKNRVSSYGTEVEAVPGDTVFYKVRIVNTTDKTMNDIVVTDMIPAGLILSEQSNYNENTKYITSKIGNLLPGESKVFITEMTVSEKLNAGDIVDSEAEVKMDDETVKTNSVRINVVEEEIAVASTDNRQSASIIGSNSSFLPTTLTGWLGLILFVLAIAFLISKLFAVDNSAKATLAELRAMEAAKMRK